MHELGLCDALLKKVDAIVKENGCEGVNSVTLEIGTLSGVEGQFMADCWKAVTDGTEYQGTELIIIDVPGRAQCLNCDEVFTADLNRLECPRCGGRKLNPVSGRDMTIAEIEAY